LPGDCRTGAMQVAEESRRLLQEVVSEVVPFTIETADHYARIRGTLGLSPADAIHLAPAAQAGTDLFLTNDKRLVGKIVPGIQFIAALDNATLMSASHASKTAKRGAPGREPRNGRSSLRARPHLSKTEKGGAP
jgi:hypothetical protein